MRKEFGAENVYDFSLGNPSVPAPAEFNEAMKEVIDTTDSMMLHGYMSNAGYEISREAIANDLNKRFGTSFRMENVTMTVGAANALVVAMKILINPGDEVIVFAPFFNNPVHRHCVNALHHLHCRAGLPILELERQAPVGELGKPIR